MFKKERLIWLFVIICIFILYLVTIIPPIPALTSQDNRGQYLELFNEALDFTRTYYVEEDKVKYKDLIYGSIKGMLDSLGDEHTSFLGPIDFANLQEGIHGKFGGLGIYISLSDDDKVPLVVAPIEGTPAFKAGIKRGDKILKIDNQQTNKMSLEKAISLLKGDPGTSVSFEVYREGELDLIPFTIKREEINVPSVKSGFIKEGLGYIRIVQFSENTADDFKKAVESFNTKGLKQLIIDLRNNPGGLFNSVTSISNYFLPKGSIIVRTQGRNPYDDVVEVSQSDNPLVALNVPVVILINGGSASASEILAGALQDTNRATIMGTKSYGKGTVQNVITLKRGEEQIGLRITVQRYFTPSGRCIHKKGIEPDIESKFPERSIDSIYMERKLEKGKYIKTFIKDNPKYTEKDLNDFINKMKDQGIVLEKDIIIKHIDSETQKEDSIPLYDLKNDVQLNDAIKTVQSNEILKKEIKIIKR